jgi:hypothetical protein
MNPFFPYSLMGYPFLPYLYPFHHAQLFEILVEAPKDVKFVSINVIYAGFDIPKVDGRPKFRFKNDHFCATTLTVDINNTTGDELLRFLGGGTGSTLQEVFEDGEGEWSLGYKEIVFASKPAKKKLTEYGWSRGNTGHSRGETIWVVFGGNESKK